MVATITDTETGEVTTTKLYDAAEGMAIMDSIIANAVVDEKIESDMIAEGCPNS